jgi:hypothetical protein
MSFTPVRIPIETISNSNPGIVTTSTDHNLTTGQVVRLHVPQNYGMVELNNILCIITVLSATTFSIQATQVPPSVDINTSFFPTFVIPSNPRFTAEVLPVGSGPTPITNTEPQQINNVCDSLLGDAYDNISTTPIPF